MSSKTAKIFTNGGSQAVRLPAEFRFEGEEVYIRRDPVTGDVILSKKPGWRTWQEFFALRDSAEMPPDYFADRPLNEALVPPTLFKDEQR